MGTPPDALLRLIDRFGQNRKVFLSGDYKEEQLRKTTTSHEQESLRRQISATDRQTDVLVYELYGQTQDEFRIVEGRK